MQVIIRKSAQKDLLSLEKGKREKLLHDISDLERFPHLAHIKKLIHFEPAFRLRSGDFRILFDVIDDTVFIGRILHRKDAYKK